MVDSLLGMWWGCDMFEKVARSVALTCMATGSLIRKIACLPSSDVCATSNKSWSIWDNMQISPSKTSHINKT
jgi:hypothetical protein